MRSRTLARLAATAVLAAVLSTAVYGGTLHYPFVFDDHHTVVDNSGIREPRNVLGFFSRSEMLDEQYARIGFYRPALFASYTLDFLAGGLDPARFRLTNVILHVVNCCLLFLLIQALCAQGGRDPWPWSLAGVMLFAAHPVQTEAVVYVAARSALLMSTFCLMALLFFVRHRAAGGKAWLAAAAVSFALALLTKEPAVPMALLFVLLGRVSGDGKGAGSRLSAWLPCGIAALFLAVRAVMLRQAAQHYLVFSGTGLGDYARHWALSLSTVPRYAWLLVSPAGLSVDHGVPLLAGGNAWLAFLGALLLGAWALLALRALFRGDHLMAALLAWPLLALSMEMILPVEDVLVEYRLYLPLAGLAALLAAGAGRTASSWPGRWETALLAALAVLVLAAGSASRLRCRVWESDLTLWGDAVAKEPGHARPHANLGEALSREGRYPEAAVQLEEALHLRPEFPEAHDSLGVALARLGRTVEAEAHHREAIRLSPGRAGAHYNLGLLLLRRGRSEDAAESFRRATVLNPRDAMAHHNLAYALTLGGRIGEAKGEYLRAIGLNSPFHAEHCYNLANILFREGDLAGAERRYREALSADSGHVDAALGLTAVLAQRGDVAGARGAAGELLRREPGNARAREIIRSLGGS